ncbi:MAG: porin [Candidatus Aminicenantia bacterium]
MGSKFFRIFILWGIFLFLVRFLFAEVKVKGYFASEYVKSQPEGFYPEGNIDNHFFSLQLSGTISPKFEFLSEIRYEHSASEFYLEQAWVGYQGGSFLNLKIGAYLVPFGRFNQFHRPLESKLITLPLNLEQIVPVPWSDIGILSEGKYGILSYSAYIGNGLGNGQNIRESRQFKDNNKDKARGGRIGLSLGGGLEVGFSRYQGAYNSDDNLNLTIDGADLTWVTSKMLLWAEYSKASIENPVSFGNGEATGYFIQLSYLIGSFCPVVSYQTLKYKDPFHGPGFISPDYRGSGINENKTRWTVGINFYPANNIVFKVEYQFNQEPDFELNNNSLWIQAAVAF